MLKYTPKKHKVTIGNKEINFVPWNAGNEKDYLKLFEKKDMITDESIYKTLIEPCIEEKDLVFSTDEQKLLLIYIRKESISETFKDTFVCKSCSKETKKNVKIDSIINFKEADFKEVNSNDIIFSFNRIKSNKEKQKLKPNLGPIEYSFANFLLHIDYIIYKGETYKEFKYKELENFVNSLPTKDFDTFYEAYEQMRDILTLKYKFKCSCGETVEKEYNSIPNFLWI